MAHGLSSYRRPVHYIFPNFDELFVLYGYTRKDKADIANYLRSFILDNRKVSRRQGCVRIGWAQGEIWFETVATPFTLESATCVKIFVVIRVAYIFVLTTSLVYENSYK